MSDSINSATFSVIVPVYNGEKYLARAINSVVAQTYAAHEIIVINDGSRDGTAAVAKEFEGRIIYREQQNSGVSAARNSGAALATGEWLAFLDADDWYYPKRLECHARLLARESGLDFIVGDFDYIGGGGRRLRGSMESSSIGRALLADSDQAGFAQMADAEIAAFVADQFSDTRTLSVPRETFVALGGFPTQFAICEDVAFLIRLCARSHHAGVVTKASAAYFVHDEGLIRSDALRAQRETVKVLRWLEGELGTAPSQLRAAWAGLVKKAYLNTAYCLLRSGDKRAALSSLWESFKFRPAPADLKAVLSILAA